MEQVQIDLPPAAVAVLVIVWPQVPAFIVAVTFKNTELPFAISPISQTPVTYQKRTSRITNISYPIGNWSVKLC
jgi:hypothetical protein